MLPASVKRCSVSHSASLAWRQAQMQAPSQPGAAPDDRVGRIASVLVGGIQPSSFTAMASCRRVMLSRTGMMCCGSRDVKLLGQIGFRWQRQHQFFAGVERRVRSTWRMA
jgi:hypothetical protein